MESRRHLEFGVQRAHGILGALDVAEATQQDPWLTPISIRVLVNDYLSLVEQFGTLQRDYDLAIGWLEQYEGWASSMPDAGLTADDPRSSWYMRRPQYPNFPALTSYPATNSTRTPQAATRVEYAPAREPEDS